MKAEERRKNVEQQSNEGTKLFDAFVAWYNLKLFLTKLA
jgi:hypothetical protein